MDRPTDRLPLVSALMAVRNDAASLEGCLTALAEQDYDARCIELIVADGGSSDGTEQLVQRFAATAPFPVQLVRNARGNTAAGFNAALREARGDVIVLLGARAIPARSFLSESVRALEGSGADAVGGVVIGEATGLQAEVVALALGSPFGVGGARYRYASAPGFVDTVNYGAYRREAFERLGGFDETMDNVEDDEFNYRLRAAGGTIYLSPAICCCYRVRPSLPALARQYARYGYPKVRVLRRHPRQMRPRQFAPAAFVLALLAGAVLAGGGRRGRLLFGCLLGGYGAASLTVSVRLAARQGWRYLPLLPPAFAGMHLAYGAASLVGAVRFLLLPSLLGRDEPCEVPQLDRREPVGPEGGR